VIAPIELKGSKNDLDRAVSGRKESAVDQGWRYANYTPNCKWVIVSNYRELRLYQTSKTPAYYERFVTTELKDLETFKRFYSGSRMNEVHQILTAQALQMRCRTSL